MRCPAIPLSRPARISAISVAALAIAASCSAPTRQLPRVGPDAISLTPLLGDGGTSDVPHPKQLVAASVTAHLVAVVPDKTIGPFIARRGSIGMAAYIDAGDSGKRRVVSIPVGPDGETRGEPRVLAPTTNEPTMLVVRSTGGPHAGFVAAWTSLTDRGEALTIASIADDGSGRGTPIELARTNDDIVWVDVIATSHGGLCVWAEETRAGDANVLAAAIDSDGKLRGSPSRVVRGVTAWQVVAAPNGAGLATVNASGGTMTAHTGTLAWTRLSEDARPIGVPIPITMKPTVSGDIDVVRTATNWTFAWTDHSTNDPFVVTAAIDDAGKVHGPQRTIEAKDGDSTLVDLTSGPLGPVIAWEEPARRSSRSRRLHLSHLDASGAVDARAQGILVQGDGTPEIVPTETGYAMLASMHLCEADHPDACATSDSIATFARFDRNLDLLQTEPLRIGETRDPVALAWGLACTGERCSALTAANSVAPVKIVAVDLTPRKTAFTVPRVATLPPDAPKLGTVTTIASGAQFADLAVAHVADGTLVATLTAAVDDGAKAEDRRGATIAVRAIDANGQPTNTPPFVITSRALTVGGVAMAAGGTPEDGAALAWVAREAGDPQVHVSRVDKRGKRANDIQLTTTKGDASDVAIAWSNGGWIVAWVDGRDGNGEVYATKVDKGLNRVAREERITNAPGDASDVALLVKNDVAWLAWADPRENVRDAFADIYLARLKSRDAKRDGDDVRVLATAAHSRSPSLVANGDGVIVGWIEEPPSGAESAASQAYGAMFATFDARMKLRGEPVRARGADGGFPASIAMESVSSPASAVHVVLSRAVGDELWLDSLELGGSNVTHAYPLLELDGPPSLDVSLQLLDGAVFFNDDGPDSIDRRIRRAAIEWKR